MQAEEVVHARERDGGETKQAEEQGHEPEQQLRGWAKVRARLPALASIGMFGDVVSPFERLFRIFNQDYHRDPSLPFPLNIRELTPAQLVYACNARQAQLGSTAPTEDYLSSRMHATADEMIRGFAAQDKLEDAHLAAMVELSSLAITVGGQAGHEGVHSYARRIAEVLVGHIAKASFMDERLFVALSMVVQRASRETLLTDKPLLRVGDIIVALNTLVHDADQFAQLDEAVAVRVLDCVRSLLDAAMVLDVGDGNTVEAASLERVKTVLGEVASASKSTRFKQSVWYVRRAIDECTVDHEGVMGARVTALKNLAKDIWDLGMAVAEKSVPDVFGALGAMYGHMREHAEVMEGILERMTFFNLWSLKALAGQSMDACMQKVEELLAPAPETGLPTTVGSVHRALKTATWKPSAVFALGLLEICDTVIRQRDRAIVERQQALDLLKAVYFDVQRYAGDGSGSQNAVRAAIIAQLDDYLSLPQKDGLRRRVQMLALDLYRTEDPNAVVPESTPDADGQDNDDTPPSGCSRVLSCLGQFVCSTVLPAAVDQARDQVAEHSDDADAALDEFGEDNLASLAEVGLTFLGGDGEDDQPFHPNQHWPSESHITTHVDDPRFAYWVVPQAANGSCVKAALERADQAHARLEGTRSEHVETAMRTHFRDLMTYVPLNAADPERPEEVFDLTRRIFQDVAEKVPLILVHGEPGVGRTLLGLHLLMNFWFSERFIDFGQTTPVIPVFISMTGIKDPRRGLAKEIFEQAGFNEQQMAVLRQMSGEKPYHIVVILSNCGRLSDQDNWYKTNDLDQWGDMLTVVLLHRTDKLMAFGKTTTSGVDRYKKRFAFPEHGENNRAQDYRIQPATPEQVQAFFLKYRDYPPPGYEVVGDPMTIVRRINHWEKVMSLPANWPMVARLLPELQAMNYIPSVFVLRHQIMEQLKLNTGVLRSAESEGRVRRPEIFNPIKSAKLLCMQVAAMMYERGVTVAKVTDGNFSLDPVEPTEWDDLLGEGASPTNYCSRLVSPLRLQGAEWSFPSEDQRAYFVAKMLQYEWEKLVKVYAGLQTGGVMTESQRASVAELYLNRREISEEPLVQGMLVELLMEALIEEHAAKERGEAEDAVGLSYALHQAAILAPSMEDDPDSSASQQGVSQQQESDESVGAASDLSCLRDNAVMLICALRAHAEAVLGLEDVLVECEDGQASEQIDQDQRPHDSDVEAVHRQLSQEFTPRLAMARNRKHILPAAAHVVRVVVSAGLGGRVEDDGEAKQHEEQTKKSSRLDGL